MTEKPRGVHARIVLELVNDFRMLKRDRVALLGMIIVLSVLLVAILAPVVAPYNPYEMDLPNNRSPPSSKHLFGTDEFGRDLLSRILYGATTSIQIGLVSVGIAMTTGILIGLIAGYFGGFTDSILMRIMDLLLAFPYILLSIVIVTMLGPGILNTMIAVGIRSIASFARVMRGSVLSVKEDYYIKAARAVGASDTRIVFRHILPNAISPSIVLGTLDLGSAILSAAALGFLGLGAQPPTPEWGLMLSNGREYLIGSPHMVIFPGLAIMVTVLGFNLIGDWLRDMQDPRLRERISYA